MFNTMGDTTHVLLCCIVHREAGRVANYNQSLKSRSAVGGTLMSRGAGHSYAPYKKPAMEVNSRH